MNRLQVHDEVREIERDPVKHDIGKDLVNALLYLQHTDDGTPERTGEGRCQETYDRVDHRRQRTEDTDHRGGQGADHILTLSTDVEDTGTEGERHRKSGKNQRCCINDTVGEKLRLTEDTVEELRVGLARIDTDRREEDRPHDETDHDRDQGVQQGAV